MSKLNQYILGLKFVFSYFTILPVSFNKDDDLSSKNVLNSMLYFLPFMGFTLGIIVVGLYGFLENLDWLGALICAIVYMMLYGFIHTEAILDVVDAIYAKHSGKDAYEVIKEPAVGAMGVLYAFALVILKLSCIVAIFKNNLFFEFISVLIISRYLLLILIKSFEFKSSFVSLLKESLSSNSLIFSSLFTLFMITILSGLKSLILLTLGFIISFVIFKTIKKKLGFLNGDALGMTLELTEILLFIAISILWF